MAGILNETDMEIGSVGGKPTAVEKDMTSATDSVRGILIRTATGSALRKATSTGILNGTENMTVQPGSVAPKAAEQTVSVCKIGL